VQTDEGRMLMIFYLLSSDEVSGLFERLGYDLAPGMIAKNVAYYGERTSHGSSLSRVAYSWVLARTNREGSWKQFRDALESDISDDPGGTTVEGIYLGGMAGTVDLMQRCYGGIDLREGMLWIDPCLPPQLNRLAFPVIYRGHRVDLDITGNAVTVTIHKSAVKPIEVNIRGERHLFKSGESKIFLLPTLNARVACNRKPIGAVTP